MSDLRSKFEEIPEIKVHLDHGNVFFNVDRNTYASEFSSLHVVSCYVNGAWFVFQEKQKKVDAVLNHLAGCNHGLDVDINFIRRVLLND